MRVQAFAAALVVTVCLAIFVAGPASAQYFGQNQVQYRDFKFEILRTAHFDIYFYPEEKQNAEQVGRLAERWYERLSTFFSHRMHDRQPVMLYASPADFRQTNIVPGLGEGTGGVTEALRRRVVLPSAGALAETDHVLGHELVHAFQYDSNTRRGRQQMVGGGNFYRLPLWFVEGMAEYLSLGPVDSQTAMWLRDAVQSKKMPTLKQLGNPRFFPYRFGHAFWAYVGGRWGDDKIMPLFREASRSGDARGAIKKVLGQDEKTFSKEWDESVRKTYAGFLEANQAPDSYGTLLIGKKRGGGELNLGPALSPDGKRIVFLSEKDLFSVDLYLANAETGKVIRKLASTATDPHFDSLEFIESAGAWSADGRRFVQSALRKGEGAFFVIEPETGRRLEEVAFKDLSEIDDPVFTPDGKKVVFTALQGGLLDLWEYDLASRERRRLTNDAFAELQPTVSPDGRTVAFTTDRFTSRLADFAFGPYEIGLLDLASGQVTRLPGFPGVRNSNPQWSPDGKSVFFLSDVHGGTDIYRVELATGELRRLTRLRTGVYGITKLSPSLSVARLSGRIAYTARQDGKHEIWSIDDPVKQAGVVVPPEEMRAPTLAARIEAPRSPAASAGQAPATGTVPRAPVVGGNDVRDGRDGEGAHEPSAGETAPPAAKRPGEDAGNANPAPSPLATPVPLNAPPPGPAGGGTPLLPPYNRVESRVEDMLQDPDTGLPGTKTPPPTVQDYNAKLQLQAVGQPTIGVGVSPYGTFAGGSTSLFFSDMLGNHKLSIAVQSFGQLQDIAGQVFYANLAHRLDWGLGAQYVPYLFGGQVGQGEGAASSGEPLLVNQFILERQTDLALFGIGSYPLSRSDRLELQATARRFGFSAQVLTDTYSLATGDFLGETKQDIDTGFKPLYLASVSGAYVHDTSLFGATAPIVGQRARLEVGPTLGSVNYTDVLADWRGYFMPVRPVTIALRAMHFGRYGSGADDPRFGSLYLGYPEFIRGYGDIGPGECVPSRTSQCPAFDRLFGSRMLVGNAELRAPLWGLIKGRLDYGPLPIDVALFADAGVAWSGACGTNTAGLQRSCGGDTPKILGGSQGFLTSVGAAMRVNVLGFLVAEISYARPFQRAGRNWVWQWSFSPGF